MKHLGDITKINGAEIEIVDVITGGSPCQDLSIAGKRAGLAGARSGLFMEQVRIVKEMRERDKRNGRTGAEVRPRYMVWENVCFAGETLVACKSGYKRIDQIAVGDEVKTHTGMYRPVAKVMRTKNQEVVRLKVSGAEDIICTPNHPLYIMEKVYANAGKKQGRSFTEPRWEAAGNLNDRCMVAYKLDEPTLPDNFITQDEAWALGRYMADGSVDLNRGTPRIFISVGNAKLEEAREHLHRLPYEIHENAPHATATNMVFTSQEFYNLVSGVGRGAGNKRVPPFVFALPFKLQKCVLDGYISGDGCIRERGKCRELCCGTASRELAYGIARMIRNVYRVGANISVRKPKDVEMGGRIIKANYPCYCVTATLTRKVRTSVCKDGFMWQMVKSVEPCRGKATVYNLSVWEDNTYGANDVVAHNCGAFSSNKGRDFAAVLEEIIRIAEPEAPDIEVPEKGWPTWGGYHDEVGGRWSVAWRVHDAQYWGVPQRRRRISVVADFGGDTAGEILFERKSVSRHPAESGTARERLAGNAENGASYAVRIRGGCDGGGKGALVQEDKSCTLGTGNDQTIFCYGISAYESNAMKSSNPKSGVYVADTSRTLDLNGGNPACNQGGIAVVCAGFEATHINLMVATRCKALGRGTGFGVGEPGDPANTISAAHSHGVFATAIPINDKATRWQGGGESRNHDGSGNGLGIGKEGDSSPTITAGDRHGVAIGINGDIAGTLDASYYRGCGARSGNEREVVFSPAVAHSLRAQGNDPYREDMAAYIASVDCRNFREGGETNGTLQAKSNGGTRYNLQNTVRTGMIVRRLTPMECERLQGFPDGWTDIGEWRDSKGKLRKPSDSPRYKALGNSIALPFWDFLAKRISAQYLRPVTMGSLFDGIGGFPLVFERHNGKGTARWASEIEEFPIAVTKLRFGED